MVSLARILGAGLVALLALFAFHALTGAWSDDVFANDVSQVTHVLAILVIAVRVVAVREHRVAFVLLGAGIALTLAGDVAWTALNSPSTGSLADVLYIAAYPPMGIAVLVLARGPRRHEEKLGPWLDGLVVGLTLIAALLLVAVEPQIDGWGELPVKDLLVNAAYPFGDALLLAALTATLARRSWHVDRRSALLGGSLGCWVLSDAIYLGQAAADSYVPGGFLDIGWLLASACAAAAAWTPAGEEPEETAATTVSLLLPAIAGLGCLVLLGLNEGVVHSAVVAPPAVLALLATLARMTLALRENQRLAAQAVEEATTDMLTGLGNRRSLHELLAAPAPRTRVMVAFDLDGFKLYNDSYGHPAGDLLLRMVGERLRDAVGRRGQAFRVGGDEFCAVVDLGDDDPELLGADLAAAMLTEGDGFRVGASFGVSRWPAGVPAPTRLISEADERLYRCKAAWRPAADRSADVLLAMISERTPDLGEHGSAVAELATAVAERLSLSSADTWTVRQAAELHDIGKMAIPDRILQKPGPLDDDEWSLMRQHTIIGERILSAAPTLAPVGRVVRASHERWDGGGYPDGLRGAEIPLGARIVAVCDAVDAMVTARPYAPAMAPAAVIEEVHRCAGTQFDPAVAAAIVAELQLRGALRSA